jgi:hypothetical protein
MYSCISSLKSTYIEQLGIRIKVNKHHGRIRIHIPNPDPEPDPGGLIQYESGTVCVCVLS